jgi:hypothetical protein
MQQEHDSLLQILLIALLQGTLNTLPHKHTDITRAITAIIPTTMKTIIITALTNFCISYFSHRLS